MSFVRFSGHGVWLGPKPGLSAAFKHGVLLMRLGAGQHDRPSHGLPLMLEIGLGGVHVHGSRKVDVWVAAHRCLQNDVGTSCQQSKGKKAALLSGIASSGWGNRTVRAIGCQMGANNIWRH